MKNMFRGLLAICFMFGCDPCTETEETEIENLIVDELVSGSQVMVYERDDIIDIEVDNGVQTMQYTFGVDRPRIDGITVGTSRRGLTTGCFSIPECVRMDEKKKGNIKISEDDFAVYHEIDNTGVLYFLDTFYYPYWYSNGNYIAFRNQVDNYDGGKYENKRKGCCLNNPEKCHCEPEE
jgi:hypothetical protein